MDDLKRIFQKLSIYCNLHYHLDCVDTVNFLYYISVYPFVQLYHLPKQTNINKQTITNDTPVPVQIRLVVSALLNL